MSLKAVSKVEAAHSEGIWALSWSPSDFLLTGSLDGSVKKWKYNQPNHNLSLNATTPTQLYGVNSITAVKDNSVAIASYQNGVIRFFDMTDMSEQSRLEPGENSIHNNKMSFNIILNAIHILYLQVF